MPFGFDQSEKGFLQKAIIFAIALGFIITSFSEILQTLPFYIQFLIITVPFYMLPAALLGIFTRLYNGFLSRKFFGVVLLFASFDLISPLFLVDLNGTIVSSGIFPNATIDVLMSSVWSSFGFVGLWLHVFTYYVSFVLLLAISAYLLDYKELKGSGGA